MPTRSLARSFAFVASLTLAVATVGAAMPPAPPRPLTDPLGASTCETCPTGRPALAGSARADFLVAWAWDFRVFERVFDANANAGANVEIGSGTSDLAGIAAHGDGWLLEYYKPGAQVWLQRLDGGGSPVGEALRVNPEPAGDEHGSELAVGNGRVLVTHDRNNADAPPRIVAHLFDGDLQRLAPGVELGVSGGRTASEACFRGDGSAVVAWNLASPQSPGVHLYGVAMRRLSADGAPAGAARTLAAANLERFTEPSVVCSGGAFAVAWHTNRRPQAKSGWDPVWQWFDGSGNPRGKPVALNTTRQGDQSAPWLALLSDGSVLAVWESAEAGQSLLRGRRFSATGKPRGPEFVLHTAADGAAATQPRVEPIPGTGRWVLSWNEGGRGWVQVFAE